jgi:prepilin-type N-terminal cleavage/methylation domain-containing protein
MTTLLQFRRPSRLTPAGFSLFEVLLVLAVIGVLLALAIPMMNQNDAIYAARDRRNAQELASTSVMAQTAGLNFVEGEDVLETVRSIVRGGMPARGAMKGRIFVVPGLSEEDIRGAARFLNIQNGELRYTNSEVPQSPGDQRL